MNKIQEVKGKRAKNLKDYLDEFPLQINPRAEEMNRLAMLCSSSSQAVYNWANGINKPRDPRVYRILSEATGLRQEELFKGVNREHNCVEETRVN